MSSDGLVKNLNENDFNILKKHFPDKWQYLSKKLSYTYEYFNGIDDYNKKPVVNLKKEDFYRKIKNKCPSDEEIERTKKLLKNLILKMEEN